MTLADIVATAKRLILADHNNDRIHWTVTYLIRDLKPQLDAIQRLTLAAMVYRQAQRELDA